MENKTIIVSEYIKRSKINFDFLFCSPSKRTKQTLSLFIKYSGIQNKNILEDQVLYDGNDDAFLLKICQINQFKRILIISHEPQISF